MCASPAAAGEGWVPRDPGYVELSFISDIPLTELMKLDLPGRAPIAKTPGGESFGSMRIRDPAESIVIQPNYYGH